MLQLLRLNSKKKSGAHEIPNMFSKTFDKTRISKENTRRASLNRSLVESQTKAEKLVSIFFKACNRMKKAQAGNIYNLMIKEPKFLAEADVFFSLFSFKLKTELTLSEFQKVCQQIKALKNNSRNLRTVLGNRKSRFGSLSREDKDRSTLIKKIFEKYDLNGDGFISISELKHGIHRFLSRRAAEELFKEYDLDNNSLLDRSEFMRLFSSKGL